MTGAESSEPENQSTTDGQLPSGDDAEADSRRIGQVADYHEYDNGCYVTGHVQKQPVDFLLDTGSNVTLISDATYHRIQQRNPTIQLAIPRVGLQTVDGTSLDSKGEVVVDLQLGDATYKFPVMVANIVQDAILGNDFISQHVNKLDYKRAVLTTRFQDIPCWMGSRSAAVCQVKVKVRIILPPESGVKVKVTIPRATRLTTDGLVEPDANLMRNHHVLLLPGIIKAQESDTHVLIINPYEKPVQLNPGVGLGTCESYYERPARPRRVAGVTLLKDTPLEDQVPGHLKELFEKSTELLTDDEKAAFAVLLTKYQNVFSTGPGDLGRTHLVEHRINTGMAPPIKQRPRRQPIGKREAERDEIEKMLQLGLVEPSSSPWASPVVLVKKKCGSTRFCIDFRLLNDVTIKDAYPLPRIDDCLDALQGAQYYSSMDVQSGFWQIPVAEEDKEKTAFASSFGLYHFNVMPFGLCNSPATFERLMENVLRGLQFEECLLFVDDIISFGGTIPECLERLERVFERLAAAGLKLKPSKCNFFKKKVLFLGHIVTPEGITTDPAKIDVVKNWPVPTNTTEIRAFVGLCSYYRRLVQDFAKIAKPLHQATEKNRPFQWTPDCQEAFETLRSRLTTAPIVAYPVPGEEYILDTDASEKCLGAVLSQLQDGTERVIAYFSKAMTREQQNYCVTRKELLAVVSALKNFRPYLYGQRILLRTDNAAVSWMRGLKNPTGQTARWLEELANYDLTVVHRAGARHRNADALSRCPCKSCERQNELNVPATDEAPVMEPESSRDLSDSDDCVDQLPADTTAPVVRGLSVTGTPPEDIADADDDTDGDQSGATARVFVRAVRVLHRVQQNQQDQQPSVMVRAITRGQTSSRSALKHNQAWLEGWQPAEVRLDQLADENVGPILSTLEEDKPQPEWSEVSAHSSALKTLWRHWGRLQVCDGMLYRRWVDDHGKNVFQLIVPRARWDSLLKYYHDIPCGGHLAGEKTLERVKLHFYWPGMNDTVHEYCRTCDRCVARKPPVAKPRAPLQQYLVGDVMERVALDIMGPLPVTTRGNRFVLVIGDQFTKFTEAYGLPNQEAVTVARVFVEEFVTRYGVPRQLHSDRGTNFDSALFKEVCAFLKLDKTKTSVNRPQSNGNIERFNRTLGAMLTMYAEKHQNTWDEHLPFVMMAYRASVHSSTGKTPNEMLFGHQVTMPLEAVTAQPEDESEPVSSDEYLANLKERLRIAHHEARVQLKRSAMYQR